MGRFLVDLVLARMMMTREAFETIVPRESEKVGEEDDD
jgi:hypothetical protein